MPKELYEEALADVKKVKQVAEDNAKRAVLEAVIPRIREFIDQALLSEHGEDGDELNPMPSTPGGPTGDGAEDQLMTDLVVVDPRAAVPVDAAGSAAAITPPDADGKVTLDIDSLCSSEPGTPVPPPMFGTKVPAPSPAPETEYEISLESIDALKPVMSAAKKLADVTRTIKKINEAVGRLKKADKGLRSTRAYSEQIAQMISRVENTYDYVQEQVADPAKKRSYETMLEVSFKDLTKLQEFTTMSKKTNKAQMNEADVTLKLTGLPDDIDLDTVGVDLITGEEDEEGMEGDQQGGLDDLEMGGQQGGQQGMEGQDQMESRELSDDTIVEIDEKMLRREIARMRNLREEHTGTGGSETKAQSWGNGPGGSNVLDDFGGGKDEGEPHDQDITDLSPAKGARPLGEADEDLDEAQDEMDEAQDQDDDQMDEADDLDQWIHVNQDAGMGGSTPPPPSMDQMYEDDMNQIGDRRTRDDFGGSATSVPSKDKSNPAARHAEVARRLGFEKKLQERAKTRAAALKKAGAQATAARNGKRLAEVKKEYALVAQRFNESVARAKKLEQIKAHAAKKLQEARSNSAAARPAETQAVDSLRKKLAETNLFNAKLLFTNKLLQNEQLSAKQKAQVIKQLDQAKTVREAKLVYESLSSTLAGISKPVNESTDRQVLGSGSRVTRPATTQTLNEGYEAERWAKLAGITKR